MTDDPTPLDRALGARPDLQGPLHDLQGALRAGPVEPPLLDACESLIRHRLGVPVSGTVPDPGDPGLDARTRAVLVVAEQFVVDPHGIDDDMRDRLLDHCSLAELATLMPAFAVFDALARMEAVLVERPILEEES
jgi:alkylhydroperoxidase family enzyme